MKHVRTETHYVWTDGEDVVICHDECEKRPMWPEGELGFHCYVGAVAEWEDEDDEGVWEVVNSLPPGDYLMTTTITTYRGREDDPIIEYATEEIK